MDWEEILLSMELAELQSLVLYLNGDKHHTLAEKEELIEKILHGKKRNVCYMLDKNSWKTLKRLVRHPDRSLNDAHYPVTQLLQLNFIEEIPTLEYDKCYGFYKFRPEAKELSEQLGRARHYDSLILQMQRSDEILLGLLHSFGVLELQQCREMLRVYGIDMSNDRLAAMITWRLSINDKITITAISGRHCNTSVVMLKDLNFFEAAAMISSQAQDYEYELCDEMVLRSRKDRYFALALPEFEVLQDLLMSCFSRRFIKTCFHQMINTYQYHMTEFTYEKMILRVFDQAMITPYLTAVKAALPDIYRKGHSAWNPSK